MARLWLSVMLIGLAACSPPVARVEKAVPGEEGPKPRARGRRSQARRGQTGQFDFYVLALSWSPSYCATPAGQRDDLQCAPQRNFAFVLHGLWPQYEQRGWPQNCAGPAALEPALVQSMLDIMPSPKLVRHEWEKHGTCSGLGPKEYLEEAREAFAKVKIPEAYRAPLRQITVKPGDVRRAFAAANPEFGEEGFVVGCTANGRFLQEVRACLTKDLEGRRCNEEVRKGDCRSPETILRPLR